MSITLIGGPSACGKTTKAREIQDEDPAFVKVIDDWLPTDPREALNVARRWHRWGFRVLMTWPFRKMPPGAAMGTDSLYGPTDAVRVADMIIVRDHGTDWTVIKDRHER